MLGLFIILQDQSEQRNSQWKNIASGKTILTGAPVEVPDHIQTHLEFRVLRL